MIDIVKEAEEDLEREKFHALLKEYGTTLAIFLVFLVIGVGVNTFWHDWQKSQGEQATAGIIDALETEDEAQLGALETTIQETPAKQRAIAQLFLTGKAINNDDTKLAHDTLSDLINQRGSDPLLRDWARINLAALILDEDEVSYKDIETILLPIIKERENSFKGQAYLYLAIAQASINENYSQAQRYLNDILALPKETFELKSLALELEALYALKAINEPKA